MSSLTDWIKNLFSSLSSSNSSNDEDETSKADLQNKIDTLDSKNSTLTARKEKYESLEALIESAYEELKTTLSNWPSTEADLNSAYKSSATNDLTKAQSHMDEYYNDILTDKSQLYNEILPEIKEKISSIESDINANNKKITNYQKQINKM